jgi:hypothetical protein
MTAAWPHVVERVYRNQPSHRIGKHAQKLADLASEQGCMTC